MPRHLTPLFTPLRRRAALLLIWLLFGAVPASGQDTPLVLLIQPTYGEDTTPRMFRPLADLLEQTSGSRIVILTPPNFLAHWETVRRNSGYDLVLDDAHFTDYRVRKFGFHVLAKVPGTTSYSLVVARNARLRDPLALVGKKIASFGPPSIGATRVNAMFPNPSRRPAIIEIATAEEGLALLEQGKAHAAMLPSAVVSTHVGRGRVSVITTTEPTPHMALSASPRLSTGMREKIRAALLTARLTPTGDGTLREVGIERFEAATAATYANQSRILRDTWGYQTQQKLPK